MAHSRSSRPRYPSAGFSWFKITAVMTCLIGAAACTIFMINGNIDLKTCLHALHLGNKKEDPAREEEAGLASLEATSDDKTTSDPFADNSTDAQSTADTSSTDDGTNPFEATDTAAKKIPSKKSPPRFAQREQEVPTLDWEEAGEKPSKKIPARNVSAKRERAGIAKLDNFNEPAGENLPNLQDNPEPLGHKHHKHPKAEVEGLSDETPPELRDEKVSRRHQGGPPTGSNEMYGQLTSPYEVKKSADAPNADSPNNPQEFAEAPPKSLKHKHRYPTSDEPADTSDDQDPFANVKQVKDERVAAKPDADPALDSADLEVATVTAPDTDIDLAKTRKLTADGDEKAAHRLLSEWYWKYPTQRKVLQKDLDELAKRIYFSPQPDFGTQYEVQAGDQLAKIARQYHVSWQYLAKLNQVQPKKLRVGKKLKVFEGPFQACVDLSDFELTVHHHGLYIKKYKVGIGKENSSPIGEFAVREKLENPTYYGPDGDVKDANDPLNPLGERWIDIGNSFGIHGTIEPDTVGKSASKGCIRMLNSDIEEVYDLLTTGSMVRIQR